MFKLLRVEFLKLRKDRIFLLGLAGMAGAPAMVALMFLFGKPDLIKRGIWTGEFFIEQSQQMLALLLGPMIVAIIGVYLMHMEYRQKTMKSLLPLPTSAPGIFSAKVILGSAAVTLSILFAGGVAILAISAFGLISWQDPKSLAFIGESLKMDLILATSFFAFLIFALAATLISKNFVAPLGLAMVCQVGGFLALSGDKGQYIWTALPLMIQAKFRQTHTIAGDLLGTSLIYFIAFTIIAILWARFNPRPE